MFAKCNVQMCNKFIHLYIMDPYVIIFSWYAEPAELGGEKGAQILSRIKTNSLGLQLFLPPSDFYTFLRLCYINSGQRKCKH